MTVGLASVSPRFFWRACLYSSHRTFSLLDPEVSTEHGGSVPFSCSIVVRGIRFRFSHVSRTWIVRCPLFPACLFRELKTRSFHASPADLFRPHPAAHSLILRATSSAPALPSKSPSWRSPLVAWVLHLLVPSLVRIYLSVSPQGLDSCSPVTPNATIVPP